MQLKEIIEKNSLFDERTLKILEAPANDNDLRNSWIFDFRSILLDSKYCDMIAEEFWSHYPNDFDLQLATLELAGVPLLSAILSLGHRQGRYCNGLIVRKSPKKNGMMKTIEGSPRQNIKTIIIDDLINSGASVEKCLLNLVEIDISCAECFSILNYQTKFFSKMKLKYKLQSFSLFTLADFNLTQGRNSHSYDQLTSFSTKWVADPKLNWNKKLIFSKSSPLFADGIVYWGTDSNIFFATNSHDGTEVWRFTAPLKSFLKGIWSSPCADDENVYFGSYDGSLYALRKKTGEQVWESSYADFIGSSPTLARDLNLIFVGQEFASESHKGSIAAIDRSSGELAWEKKTNLHVHSSPVYSKKHGLVICGSNDSDLTCLSATSGEMKWRTSTRGIIKMAAVLSDDENLLFGGSLDGNLYVFETLTGNLIWHFSTGKSIIASPLVRGDLVVIGSCDNCVYIINYKERKLLKKINSSGRFLARPVIIDNKLVIGNNAGVIYEIDLTTFKIVGQHQLPDRIPNAISYDPVNKIYHAHTCDDRLFGFVKDENSLTN